MAAIVIADVWKTTPFVFLVLLAGLQNIPKDLYEAIEIDGGGAWAKFRYVTWPFLLPFVFIALVFRIIQAFAIFDLVWVMTGGGPGGSTETVSVYSYQTFMRYLDIGYGSAQVAATVVILAVAAFAAVSTAAEALCASFLASCWSSFASSRIAPLAWHGISSLKTADELTTHPAHAAAASIPRWRITRNCSRAGRSAATTSTASSSPRCRACCASRPARLTAYALARTQPARAPPGHVEPLDGGLLPAHRAAVPALRDWFAPPDC